MGKRNGPVDEVPQQGIKRIIAAKKRALESRREIACWNIFSSADMAADALAKCLLDPVDIR